MIDCSRSVPNEGPVGLPSLEELVLIITPSSTWLTVGLEPLRGLRELAHDSECVPRLDCIVSFLSKSHFYFFLSSQDRNGTKKCT